MRSETAKMMRRFRLLVLLAIGACAETATSPSAAPTAPAARRAPGIRFRERVDSSGLALTASDFSASARADSMFVAGRYVTPNRGDSYVLRPSWRGDTLALTFSRRLCDLGAGEICVLVPTQTTMNWDVVLTAVAPGAVHVAVFPDAYMVEPTAALSLGTVTVPGR
ncbi:MAG: hypothetical protein SFW08_07820 [Gemmatimonadaceae bacterium]|nr:hypothetical protein [Gemmatimonadaceae bacterium]